jgi:hypothetical protein
VVGLADLSDHKINIESKKTLSNADQVNIKILSAEETIN